MKLRMALVLLMTTAVPCLAWPLESPYFFFQTGITDHSDMDIPVRTDAGQEPDLVVLANADFGYLLGFGGGYRMNEYLRLEGEFGYRSSGIDRVQGISVGLEGLGVEGGQGDVGGLTFLANLWYDLDMESGWKPYFGGGLGFSRTSLKDFTIVTSPVAQSSPFNEWLLADDSAWQFTYQIGAGMGYGLSDNAVITADYRFAGRPKAEFADVYGNQFEVDNNSHNFLLGFRYTFGY